MRDMPKEIQIGPYLHKVTTDPSAIARLRLEGGQAGVYGQYYWYSLEIHIDADAPLDTQREALLHEVRHGCWHVATMDDDSKTYGEEECIKRETPILLDTLRRNPALVAFLTEA